MSEQDEDAQKPPTTTQLLALAQNRGEIPAPSRIRMNGEFETAFRNSSRNRRMSCNGSIALSSVEPMTATTVTTGVRVSSAFCK